MPPMTDETAPALDRPRPILIYDGDCDFCSAWIERWKGLTAGAVIYTTSQKAAAGFPDIPADDFRTAVVLVEPDGRVSRGAEAVFRTLARVPGGRGLPLW